MIERILPAGVAAREVFGDDPAARLLPEEEHLVARAVEKRRRAFTIARMCARRALGDLGYPETAVLSGPTREPLWPDGVAGSITHCRNYCAAAVAPAHVVASVGIDAEPSGALPDGVLAKVSSSDERERLERLPAGACWDRLLFSAKESVYKAWFPLTGRWLGFGDASVTIDPATGTFTAELLVEGPTVNGATVPAFEGSFLLEHDLVLTAVTVGP